jgi:RES domain-containing protein
LVRAWKGACFRVAEERWSYSKDLFTGEGARALGGRWNQPGIATAYASLEVRVATEEWLAQLARAGIPAESKLPAAVSFGEVELQKVLDVDGALIRRLRLTRKELLSSDWEEENRAGKESLPQALGRAALALGCEALLVPSAAVARGKNLVLFPGALLPGSWVVSHGLKGLP